MQQLKTIYQPESLDEALSLLSKHGDRAKPLAGGTSLVLARSSSKLEALVDLRRAGLDRIEQDKDQLVIGAMVTLAGLRRYLAGRGEAEVLGEAAASVGSRILQNHVTVGGNCMMTYAWSDLPVALLCLEAEFVVQGVGPDGRRVIGAEELFEKHPSRLIGDQSLLVAVRAPLQSAGTGSSYRKFTLNATDQSLASVAARISMESGTVKDARIVVGGLRGLPQLATDAAQGLKDQPPEAEHLARAGAAAAREIKATSNYLASKTYRQQLAATLVEEALQLAVSRAGGGS